MEIKDVGHRDRPGESDIEYRTINESWLSAHLDDELSFRE